MVVVMSELVWRGVAAFSTPRLCRSVCFLLIEEEEEDDGKVEEVEKSGKAFDFLPG